MILFLDIVIISSSHRTDHLTKNDIIAITNTITVLWERVATRHASASQPLSTMRCTEFILYTHHRADCLVSVRHVASLADETMINHYVISNLLALSAPLTLTLFNSNQVMYVKPQLLYTLHTCTQVHSRCVNRKKKKKL